MVTKFIALFSRETKAYGVCPNEAREWFGLIVVGPIVQLLTIKKEWSKRLFFQEHKSILLNNDKVMSI